MSDTLFHIKDNLLKHPLDIHSISLDMYQFNTRIHFKIPYTILIHVYSKTVYTKNVIDLKTLF